VHHGLGLGRELKSAGKSEEEVERLVADLKSDFTSATLEPQDRAMLGYAEKLTRAPQGIRADDVVKLRGFGFDDRAIHDICAVVAYFAFVNRIADGLGVELEKR